MDELFDKTQWLYENSDDNSRRYILGERGERPLVCIGVNPSTAEPDSLDPTLKNVQRWAKRLGFDGWIMLNLYPQRATDPNGLHHESEFNEFGHKRNIFLIEEYLAEYNELTLWAAWGTLISKREYLATCLDDIVKAIMANDCIDHRWVSIGQLSKDGHPHHPLYLSHESQVVDFDIRGYIKKYKEAR